jgi:hypothetical protein
VLVAHVTNCEGPENASSREQATYQAFDLVRIGGIVNEVKVLEKTGLSKCIGDNTESITVCETSKRQDQNNPDIKGRVMTTVHDERG